MCGKVKRDRERQTLKKTQSDKAAINELRDRKKGNEYKLIQEEKYREIDIVLH